MLKLQVNSFSAHVCFHLHFKKPMQNKWDWLKKENVSTEMTGRVAACKSTLFDVIELL